MSKAKLMSKVEDLYYDGYGEYIMAHADPECVLICNGDTLLEAMEKGYLWEEYLASRGVSKLDLLFGE